jgi:DeoR/GlpR family transcriptional regulator of sugar metabolism
LTTFERRFRLINILREQPGIRVPDLAKILDVSEGTIRNDMNALSESGQLTRVWGGAVPLGSDDAPKVTAYTARSRMNLSTKQAIAWAASRLVSDGDSVLFDASTTVFHMAKFLKERQNLTVVTNGIEIGRELAKNPTNMVMLLGGVLRPDGTAITRPSNDVLLKELYIKTAFVSASGFSMEAGLTEVDFQEAQFKRAMIASASFVVALVDSSKFGKVDLTPFARFDQVGQLFTDTLVAPEWIEKLKHGQVSYTLCDESTDAGRAVNEEQSRR